MNSNVYKQQHYNTSGKYFSTHIVKYTMQTRSGLSTENSNYGVSLAWLTPLNTDGFLRTNAELRKKSWATTYKNGMGGLKLCLLYKTEKWQTIVIYIYIYTHTHTYIYLRCIEWSKLGGRNGIFWHGGGHQAYMISFADIIICCSNLTQSFYWYDNTIVFFFTYFNNLHGTLA